MRANFTIRSGRRSLTISHDPVCARCGHGESLHAAGAAGCLPCDQRASAGLSSSCCGGYVAEPFEPEPAREPAALRTRR